MPDAPLVLPFRDPRCRQVALAGEGAVVPAPGKRVHFQARRVGELEEEQLLRRHRVGEAR